MNKKIFTSKENKFPWTALVIYLIIIVSFLVLDYYMIGLWNELQGIKLAGAVIFYLFGMLIGTMVSYAFIKFPLQAISKKDNVYKNEIWEATFYSQGINRLLQSFLQYSGYREGIIPEYLLAVITASLFLYFYLSGQAKDSQIKKAVIKVQIIWLVLGLGFILLSLYSISIM